VGGLVFSFGLRVPTLRGIRGLRVGWRLFTQVMAMQSLFQFQDGDIRQENYRPRGQTVKMSHAILQFQEQSNGEKIYREDKGNENRSSSAGPMYSRTSCKLACDI